MKKPTLSVSANTETFVVTVEIGCKDEVQCLEQFRLYVKLAADFQCEDIDNQVAAAKKKAADGTSENH